MGFQLSELKLIGAPGYRQMLLSRIKMRILSSLSENFKKVLFNGQTYYCPVCESNLSQYENFGHSPKEWCPVCACMSRQRFAWLFLKKHTNLFNETPKKMLHIAPEVAFEPRLKKIPNLHYLTMDLIDSRAMIQADITAIPFPENSFDCIFCSHVMEHIPQDRKALSELYRVLSYSGWAIFMVPIRMDRVTDEDLEVIDPIERERRFGQYDHVRYYGWDFEDRLKEAGFQVTIVRAIDEIDINQFEYMRIHKKEVLFYCEKN